MDHSIKLPALLTTDEAAEYLGVSAKKLEMGRCIGMGPQFVRLGRLVRYRADDLLAYLEANTYRSTSDKGGAQ